MLAFANELCATFGENIPPCAKEAPQVPLPVNHGSDVDLCWHDAVSQQKKDPSKYTSHWSELDPGEK